MGSCGSVFQPDSSVKDINPQIVHGKDRESTDLEIQQMMALSEDGSNFKVKVDEEVVKLLLKLFGHLTHFSFQ